MTIHQPQQIEQRPLESLIPYARNARTHSDDQLAQLAASIQEFGWTNPILIDADDNIVAGHGRVLAAQRLGLTHAPCIRLSHLTETQRRAYILADNQLALNAGWDDQLLALELTELADLDVDLGAMGFSAADTERLSRAVQQTLTRDDLRTLETAASQQQPPSDDDTAADAQYEREMADTSTTGQAPIIPHYGENHQAFVVLVDNTIDAAWLRQKLRLNDPQPSYKDSKLQRCNVCHISDLRRAFER